MRTHTDGLVMETPHGESYELTVFGEGGSGIQEIEVTRTEFIAIKQHLKWLRKDEKEGAVEEPEPGVPTVRGDPNWKEFLKDRGEDFEIVWHKYFEEPHFVCTLEAIPEPRDSDEWVTNTLTPREYLELRVHLARMRGYKVPKSFDAETTDAEAE